jgi:Cellulase (glycosyl hydrolase family 5)
VPLPSVRLVSSRASKGALAPASALRSAARAAAAAGSLASLEQRDTEGLSWLGTSGNLVVDENGEAVLLRGVNVVGLDHAQLEAGQTLSEALALSESALTILTGLWGVNVVRLPFSAQTVLEGTDSLAVEALLSGLDQLVADVASAGAYVLLALQPPAVERRTPLPDDATHECWQLLASRFQDEPGVLYEIYAASTPLAEGWPDAANRLIGVVRREHPAALILVSGSSAGTDIADLPLRFTTGEAVHDLAYTVRVAPQLAPFSRDPRFRFFAHSYPLVASQWSDSSPDLGRAADLATQLFERYGIGWIAANWNAAPRLVTNAAARNYAATRFGNAVRRALGLPVRPQTTPVGADGRWPFV